MPRQSSSSSTRRTSSPKKPIAAPKRDAKSPAKSAVKSPAKSTAKTAARPAAKSAASKRPPLPATPTPVEPSEHDVLRALQSATAEDMYQREKRRRAGAREIHDPLAEARREYQALLASEAGTPRGGRPRKGRPKKSETALEDSLEEFKGSDEPHEEE